MTISAPYISQFLLAGSKGLDEPHDASEGFIQYGSIRIDQKVRAALPNNYMEDWDEWFDVQNGVKLNQDGLYKEKPDKGNLMIHTVLSQLLAI